MTKSLGQLVVDAKKVVRDILYVTIASVNKSGEPWNSPVYSAYDSQHNFFWVSWAENQHSQNIQANRSVFIVIYDSTVPEGTGLGVYMKGTARVMDEHDMNEIKEAAKLLARRKNKNPRTPEEYLGSYPRRIFKFVPQEVWVNSDGDVDGNYVDVRVDITNQFLNQ